MVNYTETAEANLNVTLAEQVYKLADKSFREANKKHKTYSERGIEALLSRYEPEKIIVLPHPIISVFAYDNETLVGCGFLRKGEYPVFVPDGKHGFLYGVYVDPIHQDNFVGPNIFKTIIQHAKNSGIVAVQGFAIFPKNLMHYLKFGFRVVKDVEQQIGDFA